MTWRLKSKQTWPPFGVVERPFGVFPEKESFRQRSDCYSIRVHFGDGRCYAIQQLVNKVILRLPKETDRCMSIIEL